MKKFYVSVDLEGIACVIGSNGRSLSDSPDYQAACEQGTREANAAVTALYECVAEELGKEPDKISYDELEVYVWDCHGSGYNLRHTLLDKRVKIVLGAGSKKRFPDIDKDFKGIIFLGYHAYDTIRATLAHVYSSAAFQHHKINGEFVGEMQIDAAIAAKHGVPVIFAAGDDICMEQAKNSFKNITTVVTKKALAYNSVISKHPLAVVDEICEAVKIAYKNIDKCEPYIIPEPFDYEIRYKRIEMAMGSHYKNFNNTPFDMPDAYTRRGKLAKIEDIFE